LQQFGAYLAVFVGAYVSLGTSCGGVDRSVELEGHTTLPQERTERHLQLSTNSDRYVGELTIRLRSRRLLLTVDAVASPLWPSGGPAIPVLQPAGEMGDYDVSCYAYDCSELFLTVGRGELTGDLDVSLEVTASAAGACDGDAPEYIETELTELD
jgi:hypothetical protein